MLVYANQSSEKSDKIFTPILSYLLHFKVISLFLLKWSGNVLSFKTGRDNRKSVEIFQEK